MTFINNSELYDQGPKTWLLLNFLKKQMLLLCTATSASLRNSTVLIHIAASAISVIICITMAAKADNLVARPEMQGCTTTVPLAPSWHHNAEFKCVSACYLQNVLHIRIQKNANPSRWKDQFSSPEALCTKRCCFLALMYLLLVMCWMCFS